MSKTIRDCSVCHEQLFCTVEQLKTHIDEHAVIDSKEWAKLRLEVDKEKRSTDAFTNSNIPSSDTEAVERVFRSKNCFQVLQVRYDEALNTNDLPALIRKRYREVARDVHPDRNMSERSTEAFRKVELSHAEATAIVSRNDQKARQRVLDLIYEV